VRLTLFEFFIRDKIQTSWLLLQAEVSELPRFGCEFNQVDKGLDSYDY